MTVDRGYGRDAFVDYLRGKGISSICVMPDHLARVHPFLPASLLRASRDDNMDAIDNPFSAPGVEAHAAERRAGSNGSGHGRTEHDIHVDTTDDYDRFVVPDGAGE